MIETIIFDLEGVIIDTEKLWDKETTIFLKRRKIKYNRKQTKHLITGSSILEGTKKIQNLYGVKGNTEKLAKERNEIMKKLIKNETELIPGFLNFFEQIKNTYKFCIATSMNRKLIPLADNKVGLKKLFGDHIYSVADVNNVGKPRPDIFLYAAMQLGSIPNTCVVIEDSPIGIEAAIRADMKCIAITTTYSDKTLLKKADLIVDTFKEINIAKI